MGYAFCQLKEQPFSTNMVPFKSLFIDDLCVDKQARGQHIGESLFEYVKQQAKALGCYEVTLNVWAGNTSAEHFYENMGMKTKERQMEYILELGFLVSGQIMYSISPGGQLQNSCPLFIAI